MIQANGASRRAANARSFRSAYRLSQRFTALLALFAMLWYSATPAGAGVNSWTGATDALWDTPTNWSLLLAPVALDDVILPPPPAVVGTITLGTGDVANSLTFRDAYTLTGGDLTLTNGNITVAPAVTGTINSILGGAGGITLAANNGLSGPDLQLGGGTLILGGANTYGGVTSINSGVLSISASGNLGNASVTNTIAIANNATLQNTGGLVDLGVNRSIAIGSGGATLDVTGTNQLTASGVISGSAGNALTKIGTGTLLLKPNNTLFGPLNINEGVVAVDSVANDSQLGSITQINLNGGTFRQGIDGQYSLSATRAFIIGAGGGTLDVGLTGAVPSNRKIFLTTNQLQGSGVLTKIGGGDLQLKWDPLESTCRHASLSIL